jgi:hypothetical protein
MSLLDVVGQVRSTGIKKATDVLSCDRPGTSGMIGALETAFYAAQPRLVRSTNCRT